MFLLSLILSVWGAPEMIPLESMDIIGHEAPKVTLALRGGGEFALGEPQKKPLVISFWASWCGPCQKELPALAKLALERSDLLFLGINVDRKQEDAEKFLSKVQTGSLPLAFDPDSLTMGQFGVMSMPTMFLIDAAGKVAFRKIGYSEQNGFKELLTAIDGLK
jgi:thiol-disulfide isomerase/thioredoxin